MSERSNRKKRTVQRAAEGEIAAGSVPANGLVRAERTAGNRSVAADGDRTRYQGGAYACTRHERAFTRQLGWYRRMKVLSQIWDGAFFICPEAEERRQPL